MATEVTEKEIYKIEREREREKSQREREMDTVRLRERKKYHQTDRQKVRMVIERKIKWDSKDEGKRERKKEIQTDTNIQ